MSLRTLRPAPLRLGMASTRRHDFAGAPYIFDPETFIESTHSHTLTRTYCARK